MGRPRSPLVVQSVRDTGFAMRSVHLSSGHVLAPSLLGLVALATGLGCGAGPAFDSDHTRIVTRLMPDGGEELASAAVVVREVEVFTWRFRTADDLAAWTPERIDRLCEHGNKGLLIEASGGDPALSRETAIDASRISAIRVTVGGVTAAAQAQIYWAPPGGAFSEERSLIADRATLTEAVVPTSTYSFAVGGHAQWTGVIGRFRLDPTTVPGRRMEVIAVEGLQQAPDASLLDAVVRRSWRVDLEGDVRSAVLTAPGHPYEASVVVPKQATLRFACAAGARATTPVHLQVTVAGGQPLTLFERTLEPCVASGAACGWHEQVIDLSELAGREVTLRFAAAGVAVVESPLDLPAWAGLEVVAPAARDRPANVVLIVLDTLRADRLSLAGYRRPTSPSIDSWAGRRGTVFANAVAQAPWTLPSHVSLFTGLDPIRHGVNTGDPAPASLEMLAETLRRHGYATVAITGGGYLAAEYALMQGFDQVRYFYLPRLVPTEAGNDIDSGVEQTLSWLDASRDRPFFLLFHTYEVHAPYDARQPYFGRFHGGDQAAGGPLVTTEPLTPVVADGFLSTSRHVERVAPGSFRPLPADQLGLVQDLYDSTVAYADAQVGRLLDRLHQLGLDDDTVVILTSDHGEALGEGGLAGHASLQECELLVPLIVAAPGRDPRPAPVERQVRLVDILPTVLDLLGLDPPPDLDGRSLVGLLDGQSVELPDEAWSYASSSNFGLSLRLNGCLQYRLNNTPWPPLGGREELLALGGPTAGAAQPGAGLPNAQELRGRVVARYGELANGIGVRVANREPVALSGYLRGPSVDPLRVKVVGPTLAGISWSADRAAFELAPGQAVTLMIEGRPFGELMLALTPAYSEPPLPNLKRLVALPELTGPLQLVLGDAGWREDVTASLDRATGCRVWPQGAHLDRSRPATLLDDELQAMLRNLGYAQ